MSSVSVLHVQSCCGGMFLHSHVVFGVVSFAVLYCGAVLMLMLCISPKEPCACAVLCCAVLCCAFLWMCVIGLVNATR